jgi:hypothetical protein
MSAEVILLVLQRFTNFTFYENKAGPKARAELNGGVNAET